MAVNATKATLVFNQYQYGWTESYYYSPSTTSLQFELDLAEQLAIKRMKLSGNQTYINYVKVSREDTAGDVRLKYFGEYGQGAIQGVSSQQSDTPTTAILVKRRNENGTRNSNLFMRGIWDSIIKSGGQIDFTNTEFEQAWSGFSGELFNKGWGFLAKGSASLPTANVTSVTQNVNGYVNITASAPIFDGSSVGKKESVFLSGVQGAAAVNGTQVVEVLTTSTMVTVKRIPIFPYLGGGRVTHNQLAFYANFQSQRLRAVERKVGRPLYLSRGRAPVRRVS